NIPLIRTAAEIVLANYDEMPDYVELHGGIIRLSDHFYISALGGEPCVEVKQNIAKAFPDAKMLFVGYMDSTAYIPDDKIIEEGGYEAEGSVMEYGLKGKVVKGIDQTIRHAFEQNREQMERR